MANASCFWLLRSCVIFGMLSNFAHTMEPDLGELGCKPPDIPDNPEPYPYWKTEQYAWALGYEFKDDLFYTPESSSSELLESESDDPKGDTIIEDDNHPRSSSSSSLGTRNTSNKTSVSSTGDLSSEDESGEEQTEVAYRLPRNVNRPDTTYIVS